MLILDSDSLKLNILSSSTLLHNNSMQHTPPYKADKLSAREEIHLIRGTENSLQCSQKPTTFLCSEQN